MAVVGEVVSGSARPEWRCGCRQVAAVCTWDVMSRVTVGTGAEVIAAVASYKEHEVGMIGRDVAVAVQTGG